MKGKRIGTLLMGMFVWAGGLFSLALINPNYTPVHVAAESKLICTVVVQEMATPADCIRLALGETIKGHPSVKEFQLELRGTKMSNEQGEEVVKQAVELFRSAGTRAALLMVGETEGHERGYLHVEGCWLEVEIKKDAPPGRLVLGSINPQLNSTFNGGTDMFIRTMRFITKYPKIPIMTTGPGVEWADSRQIATQCGQVSQLAVLDVNLDAKLDIYAACPGGDVLLLGKEEGRFEKWSGLDTTSWVGAWADFDGNGRPDLVSAGKNGVEICLQSPSGSFMRKTVLPPTELPVPPLSLEVLDYDGDGWPDILLAGSRVTLLKNNGEKFERFGLSLLDAEDETPAARVCVVCDVDDDGLTDVLGVSQKNAVLLLGRGNGRYEAGRLVGISLANAKERRVALGDFDSDGLMDAFLVGGKIMPHLLQNRKGTFEEVMRFTGESAYIVQRDATFVAVGDFNGDTFPDFMVGYPSGPPHFFFNRGFRSFGAAESLALERAGVEGTEQGVCAACWADFDGNGTEDLVVAMANGSLWLCRTNLADADPVGSIVLAVDPRCRRSDPVVVTVWADERCLGARVTKKWYAPAVMAVAEAGSHEVRWYNAAGHQISRRVTVENQPVRVTLGDEYPGAGGASDRHPVKGRPYAN